MKQFKFRYQTVLEVRERKQKAEEERLHYLMAGQAREQAELDRLKAEHADRYAELIAAQQEASLDLQSLVIYQNYLASMDKRIRLQADAVGDAAARVANQRELLLEAQREAEIMRKLKERDKAAWQKALDQAEAALLDELATSRYQRRNEIP